MAKTTATPSNVPSDLWAEALAVYTADKGIIDRANGQLRKHQLYYEDQGCSAKQVRERYKEAQLTEEERIQLYADEQRSRRALDLWSAEKPEDFQALIERAAETEPASVAGMDKLAGARAYNDGFNGGAHGGLTQDDNKHIPGTVEFVQWSHGCADGMDYAATFGVPGTPKTADVAPRESAEPEVPGSVTRTKRTRKQAESIPTEPTPESLFGDMPGLPN